MLHKHPYTSEMFRIYLSFINHMMTYTIRNIKLYFNCCSQYKTYIFILSVKSFIKYTFNFICHISYEIYIYFLHVMSCMKYMSWSCFSICTLFIHIRLFVVNFFYLQILYKYTRLITISFQYFLFLIQFALLLFHNQYFAFVWRYFFFIVGC